MCWALLCVCRGHAATVLHLDWSADGALLRSDCAGRELLLWAMPSGERVAGGASALLANVAWAGHTCVLGHALMGVGGGVNGEVASADVSEAERLLLSPTTREGPRPICPGPWPSRARNASMAVRVPSSEERRARELAGGCAAGASRR